MSSTYSSDSFPSDQNSVNTSSGDSSDPAANTNGSIYTISRPKFDARRPSAIAFSEPNDPRRPSIQLRRDSGPFSATLPVISIDDQDGGRTTRRRSLSSPPPPPTFIKRVGFDTFNNKDATDFSLALKSKHKDYKYGRASRTFLCGTDQNDYSTTALEWLMEELVDDNDEIVCLRVIDKDSKIAVADASAQEKLYRLEAEKLLQGIIARNEDDKALSIVLEFCVGKVHDTFQRMIQLYEPVMLIVGTKGRSLGGFQGLLPGSVSKYCLQHSPVPVIVVRPNDKRERKKRKRQENPSRKTYMDILSRSPHLSTINLMHSNSSQVSQMTTDTTTSSTQAPRESVITISDPQGRRNSGGSTSDQASTVTDGVAGLKITLSNPPDAPGEANNTT